MENNKIYDKDSWCTPEDPYLFLIRELFGGAIDLDVASSEFAQNSVKAVKYCTKEKDAFLLQDWRGNLFMNPPYSRELIKLFVDRFLVEKEKWSEYHGIVLTNNSTETSWCQKLMHASGAQCFLNHRIQFEHPELVKENNRSNRQGQIFFYFPPKLGRFFYLKSFRQIFSKIGFVSFNPNG